MVESINIFKRYGGQLGGKFVVQSDRDGRSLLEHWIRLWTLILIFVVISNLRGYTRHADEQREIECGRRSICVFLGERVHPRSRAIVIIVSGSSPAPRERCVLALYMRCAHPSQVGSRSRADSSVFDTGAKWAKDSLFVLFSFWFNLISMFVEE